MEVCNPNNRFINPLESPKKEPFIETNVIENFPEASTVETNTTEDNEAKEGLSKQPVDIPVDILVDSQDLTEQSLLSSRLLKRSLSYCYYLSAYIAICYYASRITMDYAGENDIQTTVVSDDYFKLTVSAVGFLSTDMVVKYYQAPKNKLYYALQLHHIIGIAGYLVARSYNKGHLLVSNLSLFEFSSIPLLFYSDRVLVPISLPATWLSYLLVRIFWGNLMLLDGLWQLSTEEIGFSKPALVFLNLMHVFFLVANNYWFYLLTRQLKRKSLTWREKAKTTLQWSIERCYGFGTQVRNFLNGEVIPEDVYNYMLYH